MQQDLSIYKEQYKGIINNSLVQLNSMKPSDWVEKNVIMPNKPFPGPFRYDKTPYTREIINCAAPDHPARRIAVKKGAQLGFSSGVIYACAMWLIKNQPGNTLITVGAPELIKKAMGRIDMFITNADLRALIGDQSGRAKSQKTGDTNFMKEFPNGFLSIYNASNHKNIRQDDFMYGFLDDLESIKSESEQSGDTIDLLEQRFAAYADTQKIFFISTPELLAGSNIEVAFQRGDQRYYNIPCPCCHEMIVLKWSHPNGEGGMHWDLDNHGHVIERSVGYFCPKCAGFFRDNRKYQMLNDGIWVPTAQPITSFDYSYHISALYAPVGMLDWYRYVTKFVEAHPVGKARNEPKFKSHQNLCLGECYDPPAESPKATQIMKNIRPGYMPGVIPEAQSIKDGNGEIVALTMAIDFGGWAKGYYQKTEDDGRADFEIIAWSEGGATYSVLHGSVGTFQNRESQEERDSSDRVKWTYRDQRENNIFDELERIIKKRYPVAMPNVEYDKSGKPLEYTMPIQIVGMDVGWLDKLIVPFIDRINKGGNNIAFGVKGLKQHKWEEQGLPVAKFAPSAGYERAYNLRVGLYKDDVATAMEMEWDAKRDESQPMGFMNFPTQDGGLYGLSNFFSHFEAEERKAVKDKTGKIVYRWEKKGAMPNHHFDTRVYNLAMMDIMMQKAFDSEDKRRSTGQKLKSIDRTWGAFVALMK